MINYSHSSETTKAKDSGMTYSKWWKKKPVDQELCFQQNYPLKLKANKNIHRERPREFITCKHALPEILKEIF